MPILGHIFQKKDKKGFKKVSQLGGKIRGGSVKKDFKPTSQEAAVKKSASTTQSGSMRQALPDKVAGQAKKAQKKPKKRGASVIKFEQAHFAHGIVIRPHISEKSVSKNNQGKYVFEIHRKVSKPQITRAIETLYGVKVEKVNKISVFSKSKKYRRIQGKQSRHNKAVVTLKKGQEIEVLPQ